VVEGPSRFFVSVDSKVLKSFVFDTLLQVLILKVVKEVGGDSG